MDSKFRSTLDFPSAESPKLDVLAQLFFDWHRQFAGAESGLHVQAADEMVFDGFYPHYFSQKRRLLFIGREARGIAGFNYLDVLHHAYTQKKMIGDQQLNRSKFHSRMLQIAWGISKDFPTWDDIPYACDIGDSFATSEGLSLAFMNISKLSNEGQHWSSDWDQINTSHRLSSGLRNFNAEAVSILEPHVVITMNLGGKLSSLGELVSQDSVPGAESFWLTSGSHRSLLIDTWHFSAPRKRAVEHYYEPIRQLIQKAELTQPVWT